MNTIINVTGVVSHKQVEAKNEINEYLTVFAKNLSEEVAISQVIVASDFEGTVNKLWSGSNESSLKYAAKRPAVRAVGKTLYTIKDNGISFDIVIDAKYIGNWESSEKATRFEIFLHEFVHAFLSHTRFKRMGAGGFRNDYRTIEGACFSLALTRDEYIVDSYLDALCKKFLTGTDDKPIGLLKLNLERGINYLEIFTQLLENMPDFVKNLTAEFKTHQKDINVFWNTLCSYVEELLTIFAHLAGSQEKEDNWAAVSQALSGTEAYQTFLAGHLKKIYLEWINYFSENYDEAKSLAIIQSEIQGIFRNCGLNFKNVAKGIYITFLP